MHLQAIANYTHELEQFNQLIDMSNELNILMLQGESGSGKSHFISHCLKLAKELPSAHVKLENGGESVTTLFNVMGSKVGRQHLPLFSEAISGLVGESLAEEADAMWQIKLRRYLRQIGKTADLPTKLAHFQVLTDSWFADSLNFPTPLIVAIDTYEKRSTEFDNWIRDEFLYGIAHSNNIKVLLGGQSLPDTDPEWEAFVSSLQLKGVSDPQDWLAWGEEVGLDLPSADVIMGICMALKGNPSAIVQTLEASAGSSPQDGESSTSTPEQSGKSSTYQMRKRIRENMIDAFSLSEIKDLCFDLDIDYENLPDHSHKPGLARELVGYLGRNGRLDEFVGIVQEERPEYEWA